MKNLLYTLFLFFTQFAFAQSELPEGFGDYRTIENPEPGKTYTQAYIPPTFKTIVWRDSILLLNNNRHLLTNLTEGKDYEIITEVVEIRPAYTTWEFEEPTIDTIIETKTIIVDRICEEIEPMPKFENQIIIDRQKMFDWSFIVTPRPITKYLLESCTAAKWKKYKDAEILNYAMIEMPENYANFQKQVFQKDSKWWTETIADTLIAKRKRYLTVSIKKSIREVPAMIDTFHRIAVYENVVNQLVRPSFSVIYVQKLDIQGHTTKWEEVFCSNGYVTNRIKMIQEALVEKGYEVPVDNIFGEETKAAIFQFQKDNNLPQGHLDIKTLKALGVY